MSMKDSDLHNDKKMSHKKHSEHGDEIHDDMGETHLKTGNEPVKVPHEKLHTKNQGEDFDDHRKAHGDRHHQEHP